MMRKVLSEPEGFFGMLVSGFAGLAFTTGVLGGIAWMVNPVVYNMTYRLLRSLFTTVWPQKSGCCFGDADSRSEEGLFNENEEEKRVSRYSFASIRWDRIKLFAATMLFLFLQTVRPLSPYRHMSGTLPFTMFEGLWTKRSAFCEAFPWDGPPQFPYPELIRKELWIPGEDEEGGFGRGWRPGSAWWMEGPKRRPSWLKDLSLKGFDRFFPRRHGHHGHPPMPPPGHHNHHNHHEHEDGEYPPPPPPFWGYDPVFDPLKISNLDQPVLQAIQETLQKQQINIKHIVLLTLESTRKDVFPLIKNGPLYNQIVESRGESVHGESGASKRAKRVTGEGDAWADLAELAKIAELVTGEDGGFGRSPNATTGVINVHGALTGSSFTLKSLLGSHCGVSPLAVDFLEELESDIYQPCLPHVLNLLNSNRGLENGTAESWRDAPWRSVFMQASTTKFDRQAPFLKQIGFDGSISREDLQATTAKYPPKGPELNYFGYSETELKPYIRDLFTAAKENEDRVFLSHLTSSTHHPWATPEEFGEQKKYWGGSRGNGGAWDRYLNSIKWGDNWIGEVLEVLEELDVAKETLTVMIGDHGFSFGDDSNAKTTYANPHINNFHVPLLFHHPSLPNLQLNATVSSMSILPTILDLLRTTNSLSHPQSEIAGYLTHEYEAQSLIRPFLPKRDGRQQWNFGVVNPGGTHYSIMSAAHPYRLVIPVCEPSAYTFSDLSLDPAEKHTVQSWDGGERLRRAVANAYGAEAGKWVKEAEDIGGWMIWEGRRRWKYEGGTRREDRGPGHNDDGLLEHDHWWNTR
ncbi:hypothetical protein RUND412_009017 [Rhizina undulata]